MRTIKDLEKRFHLLSMQIMLQKSLFNIDFLLLSEDYDWDTSDATIIKFLQAVFKNRMTDSAFNPFLQISPEIESEVESIMSAQEEYEYELQVEREQAAAEGRAEGSSTDYCGLTLSARFQFRLRFPSKPNSISLF